MYIYVCNIYNFFHSTRVLDMCNKANITSSQDRQNNYYFTTSSFTVSRFCNHQVNKCSLLQEYSSVGI